MVFYCRCLSFLFEEKEEIQEDFVTQTKSISSGTFYTASSDFNSLISHKSSNLRVFTHAQLKEATNDFCWSSKISENGIWDVHRGVVKRMDYPFNKIQVDVKRAKERWLSHKQEWLTEINTLGLVKHPNLVRLVGYYSEEDAPFLVYEYTSGRSVSDHLYSSLETTFSWTMRFKVAQDVAHGLAYLRERIDFAIIFGDFKSSNILLDEQRNAKFSDFGLTSLRHRGLGHISPTTITTGYEAIEYMETGCHSSNSDVWSYGVFLCELITGKHPLERKQPQNLGLVEWVKPFLGSKGIQRIIDPRLKSNYSVKMAQKVSAIAKMCLLENPKLRPNMTEVLEMVNRLALVASQTTNPEPSLKSLVRGFAIKMKNDFTCTTKCIFNER